MSRYFFSGGIMPGDGLFSRFCKHLSVTKQWRWSGSHYSRTSEDWLANMDRQRDSIMQIMIETYGKAESLRWFNRWRIFFLAVSELFNTQQGQQWWVSHYLFEKTDATIPASSKLVSAKAE